MDGLTNAHENGTGIILKISDETIIKQSEVEVLIARLRLAQKLKVTKIRVFSDSQLVVNQVNNEYTTKDLKIIT